MSLHLSVETGNIAPVVYDRVLGNVGKVDRVLTARRLPTKVIHQRIPERDPCILLRSVLLEDSKPRATVGDVIIDRDFV